jgi:thiamine biosynthesis lipoprotein
MPGHQVDGNDNDSYLYLHHVPSGHVLVSKILNSIQRFRPLLGTLVAIEAEGGHVGEAAVRAAFGAIERVAALMHPGTLGSDVQRISAAASGGVVQVDPWTFAVLALAQRLHRESAGVFDPCLPRRPGRVSDLVLLAPDAVRCGAPVALDLGGIAKGFAVDRAIDRLQQHGCTNGFVNAGGDLRCFGALHHKIFLSQRFAPSLAAEAAASDPGSAPRESLQIDVVNSALAVSGPRSAGSPSEHLGYYDGATRETVVGRWAAVIANEAAVADALCKCVMLGSRDVTTRLLATHGARLVAARS